MWPVAPLLGYSFYIRKFTSTKISIKQYDICLKILEMANLDTQNFKNFWGSMPSDHLESWHLRYSSCPLLLKALELPLGFN